MKSVNANFRKATKIGAFPNEDVLSKLLLLRITEPNKMWKNVKGSNWAMVKNQLATDEIKNNCYSNGYLFKR